MTFLIRVVVFAAVGFVIWKIIQIIRSPSRSFKCATCRHCKTLHHDGSICMYANKETFKNPVHIENCTDYQKR